MYTHARISLCNSMTRYGQYRNQRDDKYVLKLNMFAFVAWAVARAEKRRSKPFPVASSKKMDKKYFVSNVTSMPVPTKAKCRIA